MNTFWSDVGHFLDDYQVPLKIALILVCAVIAAAVLSLIIRRSVNHVVRRASERQGRMLPGMGPDGRAVQRARTAGSISTNIVAWVIAAIAITMVLGVLGVNLTAILASAGVLAAALAFGAQNLIRDVLAGLFMVMEDQLGIGDSVDTGTVAGTVEFVGIRVTQIRDQTGALWFVRNGEISAIANDSRQWRRIILDLVFAAETSVDAAREAVLSALRAAAGDASVAPQVLEEPVCLDIQAFDGASAARPPT